MFEMRPESPLERERDVLSGVPACLRVAATAAPRREARPVRPRTVSGGLLPSAHAALEAAVHEPRAWARSRPCPETSWAASSTLREIVAHRAVDARPSDANGGEPTSPLTRVRRRRCGAGERAGGRECAILSAAGVLPSMKSSAATQIYFACAGLKLARHVYMGSSEGGFVVGTQQGAAVRGEGDVLSGGAPAAPVSCNARTGAAALSASCAIGKEANVRCAHHPDVPEAEKSAWTCVLGRWYGVHQIGETAKTALYVPCGCARATNRSLGTLPCESSTSMGLQEWSSSAAG